MAVHKHSRAIRGYLHLRHEQPALEISYLKVQREFQRQGVARLLLEGGVKLAKSKGWSFNEPLGVESRLDRIDGG